MKRLFVIRHGSRIDFEDKGWRKRADAPHDPPLSELGLRQARETGEFLRRFAVGSIYASPFTRTMQTASAIASILDLPLYVEPGLSEWLNPRWADFSAWELDPLQLARTFPRVDLSYSWLVVPRAPETEEQVCRSRFRYTIRHLAQETSGDVALVTHGIGVQTILDTLVGKNNGTEKLCGINILQQQSEGWQLVAAVNDHLSKSESVVQYH
jgi:broad specificity phosphatase PhoE